jgi:hypothetical protein
MDSGLIIALEVSLVFGLVIAWGVMEMRSLAKARRERESREAQKTVDEG